MDGIVTVSTAEALEMARRLAREEGLLCGPSSGMNVVAVRKVAAKHPELRRFVTVVPDTGQRYLSGELFGERIDVEETDRDHTPEADILAQVAAQCGFEQDAAATEKALAGGELAQPLAARAELDVTGHVERNGAGRDQFFLRTGKKLAQNLQAAQQ